MKPKDALWIINEIRKIKKNLNNFEKSFLGSVENSIKQFNNTVSKKQESVLLEMYKKSVGGSIYQQKEIIKK